MKTSMFLLLLVASACSSAVSSAPDLTTPMVVQFTELSRPVAALTNQPGWVQANFIAGAAPVLTSTGGQGAAIEVRSREGDTLIGIALVASGNGVASLHASVFAFTADDGSLLADVFDQHRSIGFSLVPLPLKAPHFMAPGEGIVVQLDATGQGYQVASVQATWTRPL